MSKNLLIAPRLTDVVAKGDGSPVTTGNEGMLRRTWRIFWAILRQRCPRCRTGRIFRGTFAMNDPCPRCGLLFYREEGYFLGAMYMSYAISLAILTPLYFTASAFLPNWDNNLVALLATGVYLPFVPAAFRYSRVLWIYFDRLGSPDTELLLTSFEKRRLREIAEAKHDKQ